MPAACLPETQFRAGRGQAGPTTPLGAACLVVPADVVVCCMVHAAPAYVVYSTAPLSAKNILKCTRLPSLPPSLCRAWMSDACSVKSGRRKAFYDYCTPLSSINMMAVDGGMFIGGGAVVSVATAVG